MRRNGSGQSLTSQLGSFKSFPYPRDNEDQNTDQKIHQNNTVANKLDYMDRCRQADIIHWADEELVDDPTDKIDIQEIGYEFK